MADAPQPLPAPITAAQLMATELPSRTTLLDPILARQSLVMLYGPRGLGKTFVALGIASAVATGGSFLGWHADRPRRVLYIDGEMPAAELQGRLRAMGTAPEKLDLVMADLLPAGAMPDLGEQAGQLALMKMISEQPEKPALLVLDNLASLVGFKRNDPDSWSEVQRWFLVLRRFGAAVLMVHHANKEGDQRGTSRREDVLDVVLALHRPTDYSPGNGAHFQLHFEKARGLHGRAVEPLEVNLGTDEEGLLRWTWRQAHVGEFERVVMLLKQGLTPLEVAAELGLSKSKSYRLREKAVAMGLMGNKEP